MKIYYIIFFILDINNAPSFYTFNKTGNYLESAYNPTRAETLITFSTNSNSYRYLINNNDGTIINYYESSTTFLSNSKLFYFPPFGIYLLANKNSYIISSDNITNTKKSVSINDTNYGERLPKISALYNTNQNKFLLISLTTSDHVLFSEYDTSGSSTNRTNKTDFSVGSIACILTKTNARILCFYSKEDKKEYLSIINYNDFTNMTETIMDPESNRDSFGEDIIYSDFLSDTFLICVLKNEGYYYCDIGQYYSNDTFKYVCPYSKQDFAVLFFCQEDIRYTAISMLDSNRFVAVCKNKNNVNEYLFSEIITSSQGDMQFVQRNRQNNITLSIGSEVSYVGLSILNYNNINFIAMFFNTGSNANYAILFYPNCEDYELSIYKSNGRSYAYFSNHIAKGLGEDSSPTKIKIVDFDSTNNELIFYTSLNSTSSLILYQPYDASTIYFSSGSLSGTFKYKFIPVNSANTGIRQCTLTIKINNCYIGCGSCKETGTSDDDMKCLTCDESSGYYNKVDKPTSNCYTGPQEKYYLSNNKYEKCYESCLTCNGEGSLESNNCITCDNAKDFYKVDDSSYSNECWNKYTKKDNYVLTGESPNQSYRACYIGCASCLEVGDSTNQKCTTCNNKDGYYALIDDQSNCINTKPYNYYLDNYTKVYNPCYSLCDECTDGYTSTNHNCIRCNGSTISHPLYPSNCVTKCAEGTYWYIDDNGTYKCTSGLHCPEDRPILEKNNNQCIENCKPSGTCVYCKSNVVYELNIQCVNSCPYGYLESFADRYCIDQDICKYEGYTSNITIDDLNNNINSIGLNYSIQYAHTEKQVVVIFSPDNDYKTMLFELEECTYNIADDLTKLNLENCPEKLRDHYKIPSSEKLIILKTDIFRSGQTTNQIAYAFFDKKGNRLDLNYCSDVSFEIKYPITDPEAVELELAYNMSLQGIDIYDMNDPFFNDICYPFTSEDGKDVSLEDRREYYYKNVSFCEDDCDYKGIDYLTKEAICECNIKTNFITEALNNSVTGEFLEMIQSAQVEIFRCYKNVFNKELIKNVGCWIMIAFFICEFIFFVIYCFKGITSIQIYLLQFMPPVPSPPPLEDSTNQITNKEENKNIFGPIASYILNQENEENNRKSSFNINAIETDINTPALVGLKQNKKKIEKISLNNNKNNNYFDNSEKSSSTNVHIVITTNKSNDNETVHSSPYTMYADSRSNKSLIAKVPKETKEKFKIKKNKHNSSNLSISDINTLSKSKIALNNSQDQQIIELNPKQGRKSTIEEDNDFSEEELNELCVEDARKYDNRTFIEFYWYLLKTKQDIINTFFNSDPLDCFTVRCICFIYGIAVYFFVNALFFIESYISSTLHGEEKYSFISIFQNEISRLIYSSIVAIFVDMFENCLSNSKKRLETLIRKMKMKKQFVKDSYQILKSLRIRHKIFFIVGFITMIVYWYYTSAFCNVYYNSRRNWLEGSIFTFLITNVFIFIYCFLIAVFRYLGLKCRYLILLYKLGQLLT